LVVPVCGGGLPWGWPRPAYYLPIASISYPKDWYRAVRF